MLKEFFLVDFNSINSFKEISAPLLDIATESFLLIAAIFELFKGFVGKSNVESRITIFILAAISMTVFNQYNQKVLDVSFETSDKILSNLHITSMTKISDIMKSTPEEQIIKGEGTSGSKKKSNTEEMTGILGQARTFMANNLAIALAWLVSVIAIGLSRILFTVIYYALVVLAPLIIFISVFPGFESSLKTFWQTYVWCFLAPIVFSVIFVLMHLIAQKETSGTGLEQLINVLLYGIFLVGSFIMTYKIASSQPISGFAEHASMIGAMAMASPFTAASGFAQSAVHSPIQTFNKTKDSLGAAKRVVERLSKGNIPHSGIKDINNMSHPDMEKKFGKKSAAKLYSEQMRNNYHGNKFGLTSSESSQTTNAKNAPRISSTGSLVDTKSALHNTTGTSNNFQNGGPARVNSIQSLKSKYQMGVNNVEDGNHDFNSRTMTGVDNVKPRNHISRPTYKKVSPSSNGAYKSTKLNRPIATNPNKQSSY